MEFYRSVFGGKLTMNTFKEFHASEDPGEGDKIMHAMLEAENGITFMAADTPNEMEYHGVTHSGCARNGFLGESYDHRSDL